MHAPTEPAPSLSRLAALCDELMRHAPFAQMQPAQVEALLGAAREACYAPDEVVLEPAAGAVRELHLIRQGRVTGRRGIADTPDGIHYEAGDMFPVGALLDARAVTATYTADSDLCCLLVPAEVVQAVAAASPPFADFLNRRVAQLLALSRRALQASCAAQALAEQSLEAPLGTLARPAPYMVTPQVPLAEALAGMHERRIGSVLVAEADGTPRGILTRHDILGRVTLPQRPLSTPIAAVMTEPLHTLRSSDSAQEAALLMSRHGIRHVPVTEAGRLVGIVSERDLFALQRLSINQTSSALRRAADRATLEGLAGDIRQLARNLLGQGVQARQLTELISRLNDLLTERLVTLTAQQRGLDLRRACWLAFGSEGRGEQTIATDQDNGLVLADDATPAERRDWIAFGQEVNAGLAECGYPLCPGKVMAGNPDCCLTGAQWASRFAQWMAHGAPEDLLQASIYFDLRPIAGQAALALPLREQIGRDAARLPRFQRQLAVNALARRPPLNWLGALEGRRVDGREVIDLKLQGSAVFVDAARLYALAHGIAATGTRARLDAAARALQADPHEGAAWADAFEILQMLRLRVQLAAPAAPNQLALDTLNDLDRRMLKESLRVARQLQQRLELDYRR